MNTDMKKQTAVEFLGHELNVKLFYDISPELWEQVNEIFKQAKAMERDQVIDAYLQGSFNWERQGATQFYNETYGGDE
jgi:hypothetical protein